MGKTLGELEREQLEKEARVKLPEYGLGEELMSAISHGLGAAFGIVALILCIVKSVPISVTAVVSSALYGSMLILLFTMSTIYHALKRNAAKRVFRVLDHCTIYLLIVGTYIPLVLVGIGGAWGWTLFGVVTGAAILGIVFNAVNIEKFKKFSMISYIAMGWVIIIAIKPLLDSVGTKAVVFLLIGGLIYMLGAIIYGIGSKVKYLHSIWHFFVLGGSIMHFLMIYLYIL